MGSKAETSVERDDSWRSLLSTEAVIVASSGNGTSDCVAMLVDSKEESSCESSEVGLGLLSFPRSVQVLAAVGIEAPVGVFATAVDACEWLLVPEEDKAMLGCNLPDK